MNVLKFLIALIFLIPIYSSAQLVSDDFTKIEFLEIKTFEITKEEAIKKYDLPEELPTWLMNDLIRVHNRIENVDALGATKEELISYQKRLIEKETIIRQLETEMAANNKRIDDLFEYGTWFVGIISFLFIVFGISTIYNAGSQAKKEVEKGVKDAKEEVIKTLSETDTHANKLIKNLEEHNKSASETLDRLIEKEDSIINELSELQSLIDDSNNLLSDLKVERSRLSNFEDKFEMLQSEISKLKVEISNSKSEEVFREDNYNIDIENKEFNLAKIRESMKKNRVDIDDEYRE